MDLNLILQKVLGNLQAAIEESNAVVTSGHLPAVRGHGAHFTQLFQNLIDNAIKYRGKRAPQVRISVERKDGGWRVAVADNGIGIAPEYREKVFGVFKRLHGRTHRGTGIGLAICQRVVERYNGRIWVESQVNAGSTFYFHTPGSERSTRMSGQAFRILLVEDNPAVVYLFRKALTSAGLNFELTVIEDGAEAIAFACEEGEYPAVPIPDLAVLDLNLPKNEGSQVLEAIRRNNRFSDVPVVIASSSSSPRERARTEELGVDLFLTKPADLEGFLQMGTLLKDLLVKRGEGRPAANAAP